MRKLAICTTVAALFLALCQQATFGQDDVNQRLQNLTQRLSQLESKTSELLADRETAGAVLLLFGAIPRTPAAEYESQRMALVFHGSFVQCHHCHCLVGQELTRSSAHTLLGHYPTTSCL